MTLTEPCRRGLSAGGSAPNDLRFPVTMALPPEDEPRQILHGALSEADDGLGFCALMFPVFTFGGTLILGLAGSIPEKLLSDAPLWIIALGVSVGSSLDRPCSPCNRLGVATTCSRCLRSRSAAGWRA